MYMFMYTDMYIECLTVVLIEDSVDDGIAAAGDEDEYLREDVEVEERRSFVGLRIKSVTHQSALRDAQRHELGHVIGHLTDDEDDDDG